VPSRNNLVNDGLAIRPLRPPAHRTDTVNWLPRRLSRPRAWLTCPGPFRQRGSVTGPARPPQPCPAST